MTARRRHAALVAACCLLFACGEQALGEPVPPPKWPLDNLIAKRPPRPVHGSHEAAPASPADPAAPPAAEGEPAPAVPEAAPGPVVTGLAEGSWVANCPEEGPDCTLRAVVDGAEQEITIPRAGAACTITGGKLACAP